MVVNVVQAALAYKVDRQVIRNVLILIVDRHVMAVNFPYMDAQFGRYVDSTYSSMTPTPNEPHCQVLSNSMWYGGVSGYPRLLHAWTMRHTDRDEGRGQNTIYSLNLGPMV